MNRLYALSPVFMVVKRTVVEPTEPTDDTPVARNDSVTTKEDVAVTIKVLANDSDPNNDPLTVTITSNPGHGTATLNSNKTITYTPDTGFRGVDRFTYAISDPDGNTATATVMVRVRGPFVERVNRVNKTLLPEVAQVIMSSTHGALSRRIEQAASGESGSGSMTLNGRKKFYEALAAHEQALDEGTLTAEKLLDGSSFVLPVAAQAASDASDDDQPVRSGGPAFWGSADYGSLSGGDESKWKGTVGNIHLGFDMRLQKELLAGLALSSSNGIFDYSDRSEGVSTSGKYETHITSYHPYLGWIPGRGLNLWATVGAGDGEIRIDDDEAPKLSGKVRLNTGALGINILLSTKRRNTFLSKGQDMGITRFKLKSEASFARLHVKEKGEIEKASTKADRFRLMLEVSINSTLARVNP